MAFPNTTFVDRVTTIAAAWLQAVNDICNTLPTFPLGVTDGGTGATTATGTGATVRAVTPTLSSPVLANPAVTTGTVDGHGFGYREVPIIPKSVDYTPVAADAACGILHPTSDASGRTFTIPSNASVPYVIGTELIFVNDNGAGTLTIAIAGTDTLRLAGAGTTGNRTLAANGIASALKLTSTSWIITGTGLS